jgi:DNA-binding SARP family transcriptional activator
VAIHEAQLQLDLPGPRDLLAALLWPESDQERSYASLRNTLGRLRSALSEARELAQGSYLSITHSALALNPDADILVDLKMVERAYAQARADRSSRSMPGDMVSLPLLQEAASYHRGDFLAGSRGTRGKAISSPAAIVE